MVSRVNNPSSRRVVPAARSSIRALSARAGTVVLAAGLLAGPPGALALGLGEASVLSRLGQPLQVEIPITDAAQADPAEIQVVLGDGVDHIGMTGVRATIVRDRADAPQIRLTSTAGHREPLIVFTLGVRAGSDQVLRDYSLLVNPPGAPALPPEASRGRALDSGAAPPAPLAVAPALPAFAGRVSAPAGGIVYGPVQPGETLYRISAALAAEHAVNRAALANALVAGNPSAFIGGDASRLLAGAVLAVPLDPATLARASAPAPRPGPAPVAETVAEAAPAGGERVAEAAADPGASAAADDLRARIAATRAAIAEEETRRAELESRLERATERIETLLARQNELDARQEELSSAVAELQSDRAARAAAAAAQAQAQAKVKADVALTVAAGTGTPAASSEPTPAPAPRSEAPPPVIAASAPAATVSALGIPLPGWLSPIQLLGVLVVLVLALAALGYTRWRARRDIAALDRDRDSSIEAARERIARLRAEVDGAERDDNVVALDTERMRRTASG